MTASPKCLSDLLAPEVDEEYIDWLIENFDNDDLYCDGCRWKNNVKAEWKTALEILDEMGYKEEEVDN